MSTRAATQQATARSTPRRFDDGKGRTWEVIAAPHAEAGTGTSAYRLFFRHAGATNPRWVSGPIVTLVRFSDQQLLGHLQGTLARMQESVRRAARATPASTRSASSRRSDAANASNVSERRGPVSAEEYAGFGASARAGEWLPNFDDQFELVAADEHVA